jgi:FtsP/CotA-like multicopper oxidase with cupredoxin domain
MSPPPLSRRSVLGGLCLAPAALPGGTAGGSGRSLHALPVTTFVGEAPVEILAYDGLFPGPVLRWREREPFRLSLRNGLDEPTNLHFHGLHVPPTGNADNVFVSVDPGRSFAYELTVPPGHGGLYWYHPHPHGTHRLAAQLWAGLSGAIVIESPLDADPALAACDEHVLLVRDFTVADGRPAPARKLDWVRGRRGEAVLVNGVARPRLPVRAGTARLRLVNASNARHLRLARGDGEPLRVIALDGRFLEAPAAVPDLLVPPAGRAELLVPLYSAEPLDLLMLPYNRGSVREPSAPEPLLTLLPSGAPPVPPPDRLAPVDRLDPSRATARREIVMGSGVIGRGVHAGGQHHPSFTVRAGAVELWEVRNVDVQDHVFHLHTWHFQVWRRNGRPPAFPAWRDTIDLRPGDRLELLVRFDDYRGPSVYHCHIAEHGDSGMMAVFEVG